MQETFADTNLSILELQTGLFSIVYDPCSLGRNMVDNMPINVAYIRK